MGSGSVAVRWVVIIMQIKKAPSVGHARRRRAGNHSRMTSRGVLRDVRRCDIIDAV